MVWNILQWLSIAAFAVFEVLTIVFYAKDNGPVFRKMQLAVVICIMSFLLFWGIEKAVQL